jgi:hypothetical protein
MPTMRCLDCHMINTDDAAECFQCGSPNLENLPGFGLALAVPSEPKPEDRRAYLVARIEHELLRGIPDPRNSRVLLREALEILKS